MKDRTHQVFTVLKNELSAPKNIKDSFSTFKKCSYDKTNHRYLVENEMKVIDFDMLTKWFRTGKASADSLCFSNDHINLVEFKTGDQITITRKREDLIKGVNNKINDSLFTIDNNIFANAEEEIKNVKLRFFLVIDSNVYALDKYVETLAALSISAPSLDDEKKEKVEMVLTALKNSTDHPDRFEEIDIWYSEHFDSQIQKYGIRDITEYC